MPWSGEFPHKSIAASWLTHPQTHCVPGQVESIWKGSALHSAACWSRKLHCGDDVIELAAETLCSESHSFISYLLIASEQSELSHAGPQIEEDLASYSVSLHSLICFPGATTFVMSLLEAEPEKRPSVRAAMEDKWINEGYAKKPLHTLSYKNRCRSSSLTLRQLPEAAQHWCNCVWFVQTQTAYGGS